MTAARYWRLASVETYGALADFEATEIALYVGATRVDTSATITSSATPTTGNFAKLKDSSTSTVCRFAAADVFAPGFNITWDFGASPKDVSEIRFAAGTTPDNFVYSFSLLSSSDGVTWTQVIANLSGVVYPGAGLWVTVSTVDPLFQLVSLQLHLNGAEGSTNFVDSSISPKTVTSINGAAITTSQSKFGGASLALNGSSQYVLATVQGGLGSGDFTLEFFAYLNNTGGYAFNSRTAGVNDGSGEGSDGIDIACNFYTTTANHVIFGGNPTGLTVGVWQHHAICRSGTNMSHYIDGVLRQTGSASNNFSGTGFEIGGCRWGNSGNGYLDEMRLTSGYCRYSSDFTPPTAPFTETSTSPLAKRSARPNAQQIDPRWVYQDIVGSTWANAEPPQGTSRDMEDFGLFQISGTVKQQGTPSNTPLARRVQLFMERSGRMIRETWSDPTTGAYTFTYLRGDQTYFVVSFDYAHDFRAVIADNLTPSQMP